ACNEEPVYPPEPQIEFNSIRAEIVTDDNANKVSRSVVGLNFKDGDGNLGLSDDDIAKMPYNDTQDPKKQSNYFIKAYYNNNGEYVLYPELVLQNGYRYPRLNPNNDAQSLEGELRFYFDIQTSLIPLKFPNYRSGDLFRFEIFILDRDFNASNIVTTE